jgi:hypothetical protein
MDPGHIPDLAHGMIAQSSWSPGLPEMRKYIGGIKYNKKTQYPIIAYRCARCGYVELYAQVPPSLE